MPRKFVRRRGHGWSRIRQHPPSKRRRKEVDEEEDGDDQKGGRVAIGAENAERWSRARDRLGFDTDSSFAVYLLDLADGNKNDPVPKSEDGKAAEEASESPASQKDQANEDDKKSADHKNAATVQQQQSSSDSLPVIMECEDSSNS